jgi:hypothetical protein
MFYIHCQHQIFWSVIQTIEDANRDFFEMTVEVSEMTTELVNRELLVFRQYQVEMEVEMDITPTLQWWGNMINVSHGWIFLVRF